MIECGSALQGQSRNVKIEAIYRVSHELATRTPSLSLSNAPNKALDSTESEVAAQIARNMIEIIERRTIKPISDLSPKQRAILSQKIYGYLRDITNHGDNVRRQASAVLEEFRAIPL